MVMTNDVKRAYFYARAQTPIYIELPPEDMTAEDMEEDHVGELLLSMYGTRAAAAAWQATVTEHLKGVGFTQGVSNPCLFHHQCRGIRTMIHGDDYVSIGKHRDLKWMQGELERRFEIKTSMIGPSQGSEK